MDAKSFLESHYQPNDWLCTFVNNRKAERSRQIFGYASEFATKEFQADLRRYNVNGSDIYLGVNSYAPGSNSRVKANVQAVRHIFLDIDKDGRGALNEIYTWEDIPRPHLVLESSPNKFQVFWRVAGFAPNEAEALVRNMAAQVGADPGVNDVARVMRFPGELPNGIPGFRNWKTYPEKTFVREVSGERSQAVLTPSDFPRFPEIVREQQVGSQRVLRPRAPDSKISLDGRDHSRSGYDWGRTLWRLENGQSPEQVRQWLMTERQDKGRTAESYAKTTVRNALDHLRRCQQNEQHHSHSRHL